MCCTVENLWNRIFSSSDWKTIKYMFILMFSTFVSLNFIPQPVEDAQVYASRLIFFSIIKYHIRNDLSYVQWGIDTFSSSRWATHALKHIVWLTTRRVNVKENFGCFCFESVFEKTCQINWIVWLIHCLPYVYAATMEPTGIFVPVSSQSAGLFGCMHLTFIK